MVGHSQGDRDEFSDWVPHEKHTRDRVRGNQVPEVVDGTGPGVLAASEVEVGSDSQDRGVRQSGLVEELEEICRRHNRKQPVGADPVSLLCFGEGLDAAKQRRGRRGQEMGETDHMSSLRRIRLFSSGVSSPLATLASTSERSLLAVASTSMAEDLASSWSW